VRERIVALALDEPELSPRELAVRFTDTRGYFVSEASVYRLLKAHDLITSPAFSFAALTYAAQHIDECLDKEDFESKRYWWRVLSAIKALEDAEPSGARH
jgi:hypothetical protein